MDTEPKKTEMNADASAEPKSAEALAAEYLDGWKRAAADLANYKRDEVARFAAVIKNANAELVRDLLPVLDSFDVALASIPASDAARGGMELIRAQFEDALKRAGLAAIPVAVGDLFDPARHEAVTEIESDAPPGTIAKELSRGFAFGDRIVRASRVALSKERVSEGQETKQKTN